MHTVIDDHSRVAYAEICADEKAATAIGVLQRAVAWFAEHGVTVERVLSDNGSAYRSHAWRDACAELGITHKRTRPYRPQTNGKIERFHRTLGDGWAYARLYDLRSRTPRSPARLAPLLQSPPSPLRHRRQATRHPADQRPWTSHLDHTRWTPRWASARIGAREGEQNSERCYMPIFDGFTDDEVDRIKNAGTFVTLPADWSPIWEKTPADKAYILLSGEVSVRRNGGEIARLGPGDIMGEAAIVNHSLRNASIVSLSKLEVLHFTSEAVRRLSDEVPAFREALDRTAQERLGADASGE